MRLCRPVCSAIPFFVFCGLSVRSEEVDCVYNKCLYKLYPEASFHTPCSGAGNRKLVRDVDCADGMTYHICCFDALRKDVQKSRQRWFRAVTAVGNKVSQVCTKLILCEQACKDGIQGYITSSYPEALENDTVENKEYVAAYKAGESQACSGLNTRTTFVKILTHQYESKICETECLEKYSCCSDEMKESSIVEAYHTSARAFHRLGMWYFDAWWMVQDDVTCAIKFGNNIMQAVKKSFLILNDQMSKLDQEFLKSNNRTCRDLSTNDKNIKWNNFLNSSRDNDPKLIESIYNIPYSNFKQYVTVMNDTLSSISFGVVESGSVALGFMSCVYLFAIIQCLFYLNMS